MDRYNKLTEKKITIIQAGKNPDLVSFLDIDKNLLVGYWDKLNKDVNVLQNYEKDIKKIIDDDSKISISKEDVLIKWYIQLLSKMG